ncbi:aldo/keto reductase [Xylariaceae sp. FL1019]|nr:aldo/keto reductase [Xylariaceae sp. FL1019]
MSWLGMAPQPKSPLARYRLLAPNASIRVSPLCVGAMNFGDSWKNHMNACDKDTTFKLLDFYYEQGGNFIDTANNYQFEESEKRIGEWMATRGVRDQMVIATKFTTNFRAGHHDETTINFQGNGTKSLLTSVKRSLEKLQTDYIDLLYIHWWDYSTSVEEVMQSLNQLCNQGKVLYLGVSDTPAWVVAKANQYAKDHGLRPFSVYQGRWSCGTRDLEREIIPMTQSEGMGICPWGALGGGKFKNEEERQNAEGRSANPSDHDIKISNALEKVARRKGTIITSVALAYVMAKTPYVFPIVGGRTIDHLKANIEALNLSLSEDDIKEIEAAAPFDPGFPTNFAYHDYPPKHPGNVWLLGMGGTTDYVAQPKAITPKRTGE